MSTGWLIFLILTIIFYGGCCFVLIRRRTYTCISIRSPKLLILNNLGNLFMCIIIILTNMFEEDDGKRIVSRFYYLTNFLIIIPFCLRFGRIIKCCEIQKNEREDLKELYSKRHLYLEKHYIKLTFIIFAVLTLLLILSELFVSTKYNGGSFTVNFLFNSDGDFGDLSRINEISWQAINFVEHMILLTFAYKICANQLKQKLRFEIISFFIIWFLYSNVVTILEKSDTNNNGLIIYISLCVCYLFLIINTILPIVISAFYRYSTVYHFTPKLMNNLYLFLSNESCYKEFSDYLNSINGNGRRYLTIYTQIMNYKLGFILKVDNDQGFLEANEINNAYFNNANMDGLFPNDVINKVRNECQGLYNNHFTEGMFDDALQHCFNELGTHFSDFRKTEKFKELYEDFYLTSYIQCKMCNVGLINKF